MESWYYERPGEQPTSPSRTAAQDPQHFKKVKIGALALYKMTTHACSGGDIEVMGLMMGKIKDDVFIVMDAFPLPVEGTETRVNAGAAANEFMIQFTETNETLGLDFVLGWYHSHPGYGCWLSGIDVATQRLYQEHQDPFVAVVIDPKNTKTQGHVQIGAFRTLSAGAKKTDSGSSYTTKHANLPAEKIEDFGVHAQEYYSLDVEFFRNPNDHKLLQHLWDAAWIDVLARSPLEENTVFFNSQISAIIKKIDKKDTSATPHACALAHHACRALILERLKKQLFAKSSDHESASAFDVNAALASLNKSTDLSSSSSSAH